MIKRKNILKDKYNESKWLQYEDDIIKYYGDKIIKWQDDKDDEKNKSPHFYFTQGLGRFIAEMCIRYYKINRRNDYNKGYNDAIEELIKQKSIDYKNLI